MEAWKALGNDCKGLLGTDTVQANSGAHKGDYYHFEILRDAIGSHLELSAQV